MGMESGDAQLPLIHHHHHQASSASGVHHSKPFNWKAPALILAFEFLESIAYAGISLNLVVYLGTVLHGTTASNAANVDTWNGTTFLTPFLGAILADTYWGKYKTIAISIVFYLTGLLVITASAIIPSLQPAPCNGSSCPPATGFQYFVFFTALYLISVGTGGVKSALLPFGGDQYDDSDLEESKKKQSFFSLFFIAINLGVFISGTVVVWIQQNVAWSLGFGISSICLIVATVAFVAGTPLYRVQLPTGSPLKSVVMVFVASFKKRKVEVPADSALLYEGDDADLSNGQSVKLAHTDGFRCLDKAAVVLEEAEEMKEDGSMVCSVTQVEEVKIVLRMLPIWVTSVLYAASLGQTATTFVQQGNAMNTRIGPLSVPAASLNSAEVIFMMVWVVFQDSVVIPIARRYTGNPSGLTQLQRMGVGRLLAVPALAVAAMLETWRLRSVRGGGNLSIAWQLPQFVVLACSDVFCGIAQLEFFYSEAPVSMRSLCSAFSFLALSLGYYVNSFVVSMVAAVTTAGGAKGWLPADLNDGHLDYYFWLWTGISAVNFVVYAAFAKNYTVKKLAVPLPHPH
ncbi:protein NRT1/ PTR FAMILY 8.3-like [Oryza brachyantha]|uniref:protein NRT1/ PTR FAMILY 8.3-like n=1 Tax=Oryza brachyantha TaxID=4533 RepID=UPI001ADAD5C7|nr:protein NRT1/ PTR FAMILY 8.3-like [Oryza brachyantha]XP_040384386.1 protein NRT1/ PTR FAMILY 8.3-like [Oryza brachyantha]